MRLLFVVFIYLIPTSTGIFAQSAKEKEALNAEALRFSAMTRKDTALLNNLLAADLMYVHSNGLTETKTAPLNAIGSGNITYTSIAREPEVSVRLYKKWAITNGTIHVNGLLKGAPFDIRLKYSAVYRKRKKTWQLVNWQSTRI